MSFLCRQQQLECRQSLRRACHILACALLYLLLHCMAVCCIVHDGAALNLLAAYCGVMHGNITLCQSLSAQLRQAHRQVLASGTSWSFDGAFQGCCVVLTGSARAVNRRYIADFTPQSQRTKASSGRCSAARQPQAVSMTLLPRPPRNKCGSRFAVHPPEGCSLLSVDHALIHLL